MGLNRLPDAERALERAVALDGKNSRLHYQLALVYRASGKEQQAKQEFAQSAALYGTSSAE